MFESYIRGVFYYNYSSCHQLHTVALSFLPYAAGKQQLEGKMPKIGHFHFTNRSQRGKHDSDGRTGASGREDLEGVSWKGNTLAEQFL